MRRGYLQILHDFLQGMWACEDMAMWVQTGTNVHRYWETVVGVSHLQDWQKICRKRSLGSWDSFPGRTPLPIHTDLDFEIYSPSFWGHPGPKWRLSLECWSLKRARSLNRAACLGSVWRNKAGNHQTFPLSAWEKADTGLQMCHPPGWKVTQAIACVWTNKTGHYKKCIRHFWGTIFKFFKFSYSPLFMLHTTEKFHGAKVILVQLHYRKI